MSVIIPETRDWSHDDLFAMQRAILAELRARLLVPTPPPPARRAAETRRIAARIEDDREILDLLNAEIAPRKSMTERLRRTTFAGGKAKKPTLRVISPDERPRELQWNAVLESWG